MKTQLLCTFSNLSGIENILEKIKDGYELFTDTIFILELDTDDTYIITYNVIKSGNFLFLRDTILIHRKKETNTLYTINSLNNLIRDLNNGNLDKTYIVNWDDYKNSIILTDNESYRIIGTHLHKILKIN